MRAAVCAATTVLVTGKDVPMTQAGLEIDHLSKRYGQVVALDDMTFDVRAGEVFGFVGCNGAG
jgi:ABC-type sugar transport system ATPase subunit